MTEEVAPREHRRPARPAPPSAAMSPLGPGEVRVWAVAPDRIPVAAGQARLLAGEEGRRAASSRAPGSRALRVASHALARAAVASCTGLDPDRVAFTRECRRCGHPTHGRPRLAPALGSTSPAPAVEISLSRTAGLVAVAVSPAPVGLDVERLGPLLAGMDRVLSPAEAAHLGRLDPVTGRRSAYQAWVAKEAVGKVRGSGLLGVADLEVAPAPAGAWRPVADGEHTWQVGLLDVGPAHVCALATPAGPLSLSVLGRYPPVGAHGRADLPA